MNGNDDLLSESSAQDPKKKMGRPPKRKEIGSGGIEASRLSYKDRNKISAEGRDPNFHYRIVNSDDAKYAGRIDYMRSIGYTLASDGETVGDDHGTDASQIGSSIGKHVGHGTKGILMKIRKEHYKQDQADKQTEVDHSELGMVSDELKNAPGMYGDGLKVADEKGTRLEVTVRK